MVHMRDEVNITAGIGATPLSPFAGISAVAASSCCAPPLALSVAGCGGAWLGGVSRLISRRPYFLTVADLTLAVGWSLALRRRTACEADNACARRARGWPSFGVLALSTLLVGVAAAWNRIEPAVMAALFRLPEGTP